METRQNEQLDEHTERYVGRRLSAHLKNYIDTQEIQAERKVKLRFLFILMIIASLVALAVILSLR